MISNQTILYRAKTFSDILGQPQVVTVLSNRAKKKNWPTATLLYGPTGTGKTSAAYLMAMAINCLSPKEDGNPCLTCPSCRSVLDETFNRNTYRFRSDSTGGKGEVQDFFSDIDSKPLYDRKKVFIIEESDQLSTAAKNSFHTILESPRSHIHFILVSMVSGGIPKSIKDRCQTLVFNRLSIPDLMMILRSILEKNGLWGSPEIPREFKLEGLKSIASCALGSAREAIQILEKCITGGFLTVEQIKENIEKAAIESRVEEVLVSLINGNREEFFTLVSQNFDTMEFLKLGYYKIARAIIYKESGTLDYESYEGFYKKLIESSNFDLLCGFFRKFSAMAENFIRLGDFILLSSDYFREWKMPLRGSKK